MVSNSIIASCFLTHSMSATSSFNVCLVLLSGAGCSSVPILTFNCEYVPAPAPAVMLLLLSVSLSPPRLLPLSLCFTCQSIFSQSFLSLPPCKPPVPLHFPTTCSSQSLSTCRMRLTAPSHSSHDCSVLKQIFMHYLRVYVQC